MKKDIIIIAEIQNGNISPITFEMASFAGILANEVAATVKIIVINTHALKYADEIAEKTGFDIIAVTTSCNEFYNGAAFKQIIGTVLKDLNPLYICIGHTSQGLDYAPGLAVSIEAPCLSGVSGFDASDGSVSFERSVYGGRINAYMKPLSEPAILTIQTGMFKHKLSSGSKGGIVNVTTDETASGIVITGLIKPESDPAALNDAKTVISVGRGVNDPQNIAFAEKFSSHFNNAAIGCSRPVVDLGWMKYKYQVGITGSVISPEIYIACGISGSSQHIAGMRGAELVISINNDPNASIFNVSDICIVDDMFDFFKAFEEIIKNQNKTSF